MQKPNIIYILGDDHRQDISTMAGHPIVQTPNLEQLAQDGVYFENSFCTSPVCTPSRTCHYSGCWERAHGINFNSQSAMSRAAWDKTFPMLLKQQGYQTAWVGKNHVPVGEQSYKTGYMEQSFDYWYGNHNHTQFYPKDNPACGTIYNNAKYDTQIEIFEEGALNFLDPKKEFIESCDAPLIYRDTTKPFCMCLTFNLPHACSTGTMELRETDDEIYKTLYRDKISDIQPPATYVAHADITEPKLPTWLYSGEYIHSYDYVKTIPALQERMVRICQTVTGMDRTLGHIREKLEELGIADNTIIVFSTDHGIHHGEHGIGGKCFLYEEDLRIPLVIYDPRNAPAQKRIKEMVAVPDFAPTMLELAGVEIPANMQGASLVPLMQGQADGWRDTLFVEQLMDTQNYPKSECLRTERFKYIRYFARTEDPALAQYRIKNTIDDYYEFIDTSHLGAHAVAYEELYDLSQDPHEEHNLAQCPEHAALMETFRAQIVAEIAARVQPKIDTRVCKGTTKLYVFEEERLPDAAATT